MSNFDALEAELERAASVAQAKAATAENIGYSAAFGIAVVVALVGGWIFSIPLAIIAYKLTMSPYYKEMARADKALENYLASKPVSTYY